MIRFILVCGVSLCCNVYANNQNLMSEILKSLKSSSSSGQGASSSDTSGTGDASAAGTTAVGSAIGSFTNTVNNAINTINTSVGTIGNNVVNTLQSGASNLSSSISSITNNASLVGKRLTSSLKSAVPQNLDVQSAADSIFNSIKSSLSNISSKLEEYNVSISYKGNVIGTEDTELLHLKAALTDQVNSVKEAVGDKITGAINGINTANSPFLDSLKSSLNDCVVMLTSDGSINTTVQEFVKFSNDMINNAVAAAPGDIASTLAYAEELKVQAQKMLEEKLAAMKAIGISQEEIQKINDIYNDTIGNTLEKIAAGDYASATAELTVKKEELKEYLGSAASNLVNSVEEMKNNLTDQLLDSTGLSETEVGKAVEEIAGSINVGTMAEKLMSGDTESLKEDVSEAFSKIKELASEKAESVLSGVNENLTNKILEATGMQNNPAVSTMLNSAVSSLNLGGIASSLFSGGVSSLKESVTDTVNNIKENLTQENIQTKVSDLIDGSNATQQLQESVRKLGDSVKQSISNTSIGMTSVGTALQNIVDSAVVAGNEEAIAAVSQILRGDADGGIQALKESGINLADNSIASSIKVAESLINKGLDTMSQYTSDYDVTISRQTDSEGEENSVSAQDGGLQDYVDNLGEENSEEEERKQQLTEEEIAERESYSFHESSMMSEAEMAHREAAHHNAKNASSSGTTTN